MLSISIALVSLALSGEPSAATTTTSNEPKSATASSHAGKNQHTIKVASFLGLKPIRGTFVVEGYVVNVYRCPTCTKKPCAPCLHDYIDVADEQHPPPTEDPEHPHTIMVYTGEFDSTYLETGKRYRVTVRVAPDSKSLEQPYNDTFLVEIKPLPEK
jgi:hypothetical protein